MSEEQKGGKLDGVAIGGTVQGKNSWPAKEGREPSWSIEIAYVGGRSFINVSEQLYSRCAVGSYQLLRVSQRAKDGKIYATAIEY